MHLTMKQLVAALFAASLIALPSPAHTQGQPDGDAAIENTPADADEPTLDDLLGLDDDGDDKPVDDEPAHDHPDAEDQPDDDADPELTRDLDKRLSGQEASDQFAQAIAEMEEVAIRLGDESDPGIDTQRMQDEIILKLEQIISSAQKTPSKSQSQKPGQPKPGQPRQADQGGQKPGEKPGQKPGDQPGDKPGDKPGQDGKQPGDQQGEQPGGKPGEKPGDKPGQQAGEQPGNTSGENQGSPGSVRNEELSMKDLREGEWGNLPPRLRDELAESLSETFNPVYRAATEAFYRRIAEMSQQEAEGNE